MTIPEFYAYLVRARHDLWDVLATVPDDVASAPIQGGAWTCLKDLVLHTAAAEDSWVHEDVQRISPILASHEALRDLTAETARTASIEALLDVLSDVPAELEPRLRLGPLPRGPPRPGPGCSVPPPSPR